MSLRQRSRLAWLWSALGCVILHASWAGLAYAQDGLSGYRRSHFMEVAARNSAARPLTQRVSFTLRDVPLDSALNALARSGVPLIYQTDLVEKRAVVSCNCRGVTAAEALDQILGEGGLEYEVLGSGEVVVRARPAWEEQQFGTVRGRVVDLQSGEGLSAVSITIVGTEVSTVSGTNGSYVLRNVPTGIQRIRAERLGYRAVEQVITVADSGATVVNLAMSLDPVTISPLDVQVSTGSMVSVERRRIGTSMAVIDSEEIEASGARDIREILVGRVAGAASFTNGGLNGEGGHILFRGASSFLMDETPLIYVDGVPVDVGHSAMNRKGLQNSYYEGNDGAHLRLDDLVLDEIERIEIIKGPAATTLFGSEGINGVIQIFTKRGSPGSSRITVSTEQGMKTLNRRKSFIGDSPYRDVLDNLFREPRTQTYTATLSGGFGDVSYNMTGSYYMDDGVAPGNDERRTTFRVSFRSMPRENLSLQLSGTFLRRILHSRQYRQLFQFADLGPEADDGSFVHKTIEEALERGQRREMELSRVYGSVTVNYSPFSFWQNRLTIGLDESDEVNDLIGVVNAADGIRRERRERDFQRTSANLTSTITYPQSGPFTSTFTIGGEVTRDETQRFRLIGAQLPNMKVTNFDQAEQLRGGDTSYPTDQYTAVATVGLFVQEMIGLFDRLYLTAGLRADGSTAFGRDLGFQVYPKFNAAYVHDLTPWWSAKLRFAWGQSGKSPEPFLRDLTLNLTRNAINNAPMYVLGYAGNSNIKPERGTEIEVGLEQFFFRNRATLEASYFHQTTKDALLYMPISRLSGFIRGPMGNIGALRSQGVELTANFVPIQARGGRSLRLGFTLTHMMENGVITDLGDYTYLSFANQTANWRILDGLQVGRSVRDLIIRSTFTTGEDPNGDKFVAGSRVPRTFGGINVTYQHSPGRSVSLSMSYGLGGHGFDAVLAQRDLAAGLIPSNTYFVPETALTRYVFKTDHLKVGRLRATYRLPRSLIAGFARQADLTFQADNILSLDLYKRGDPTLVPVDGHGPAATGSVEYVVPSPQVYRLGLRMSF